MAVRTWEPLPPEPGEPKWVGKARARINAGATVTSAAHAVGKMPQTVRHWLQPQGGKVAERIAEAITDTEHTRSIYFTASGQRLDDFKYRDNGGPPGAVYVIEHPFRPSLESCEDMVCEHESTGRRVTYDEARWMDDPRIAEQAGPSILEQIDRDARERMQVAV